MLCTKLRGNGHASLLTFLLVVSQIVSPQFAAAEKLEPRILKRELSGHTKTPLESLLKEEESAVKEKRHIDQTWIDIIRRDEQVRLALALAAKERDAVQAAKTEIQELKKELTKVKFSLEETDKEINDPNLQQLQKDKQHNTLELAKFYSVRGMTEDEKADEIGFIQSRLEELTAQLESKVSGQRHSELQLEILGLKGWLESLLARPETDETFELTPQMITLLLLLQMASTDLPHETNEPEVEIDLGSGAQQEEPESVNVARKKLAETSVVLFGSQDQLSGSKEFAKAILKGDLEWALLEYRKEALENLRAELVKIDKTPNTQDPELRAVEREITLLGRVIETHGKIEKLTNNPEKVKQVELRRNLEGKYNELSSLLTNRTVELDSHQRLLNLRNYQSVSSAMEAVSRQILRYTKESHQALIKTPLKEDENRKSLISLDIAFVTLMNALETFEAQAVDSSYGGDPYPSQSFLSSVLKLAETIKGYILPGQSKPEENLTRPSKADLVKQFHLAKNGMSTISEAYSSVAFKTKRIFETTSISDLRQFLKDLSIKKVVKFTGEFKDFMMAHPVLAKELSANLMHTYALLASGGKAHKSIARDLIAQGRIILQRRTAEDIVADLLLGSSEHVYSGEGATALSPVVLVLVDFAEKAPYLAGAYLGAQGKTTASQFSQSLASYLPFIGSYPVVQVIAGGTAGIGEVKVQKELAAKISRDQEVFANSMILAFNAYGDTTNGGGILSAVKQAAAYGLARETLSGVGDLLRTARDEGFVGYLKRKAESFKAQPGKKAAQIGVGGLVGTGTGVVVGGFAFTAASAVALPIVIIVGGGILGAIATPSLYTSVCEFINPNAKAERLKCEKLQRLKRIKENIPTLVQKGVYEGKNDKYVEDETAKAIIEATNKISDEDLKRIAALEGEPEDNWLNAVQNHLNAENIERQQMIAAGVSAQDPELAAIKKDLDQLREQKGSKLREKTIARIKERIRESKKGPSEDSFELRIVKLVDELEKDLNNLADIAFQKRVDEIALEVKLLRVRQFENALESNAQFQKNEVGLHVPSKEEIEVMTNQ